MFEGLLALLCFLIGMVVVLAVVAVIGHGIWLMVAGIFGAASRGAEYERRSRRRSYQPCVGCGEEFSREEDHCPVCGLDPASKTADELKDLESSARTVQRLLEYGTLSPETCEQIYKSIESRQEELLPRRRRKLREPATPEPQPESAMLLGQVRTRDPDAAQTPITEPVPVVNEAQLVAATPIPTVVAAPAEPPAPVEATAPGPPRRSFAEWIAVFMEERNILWGELIGGTLIVGCSIALVISLWQTLEQQIPIFPFVIFAAITSALFAAGLYTLHHWKLESTSRGLLLIGTLLIPLNFLVLAGLSLEVQAGILDYATEIASFAVFGWLLHRSSRILVQAPLDLRVPSAMLVTLAMLVSAGAQLFTPRWSADEQWGTFFVYLLSLLPVLAQVGAMGWILLHLSAVESLSVTRLAATLIALGSMTFACGVTLSFPLYAGDNLAKVLLHLSPAITLLGAPILIAGTLIHQKLAPVTEGDHDKRGLWRTLGTALALAGLFVMFGGFAVSLEDRILRWLCGTINIGTLLAVAWRLRVPALHVFAQVYLTTLVVYGSLDLHAWIQPPIVALWLSGLLVLQALCAEGLIRCHRRVDARYYSVGSGVSTVLAGILIAPFAAERPGMAALVFAAAALTWYAANLRWRLAEITYGCSLVLAGAIFFAFRYYYPDGAAPEQLLWSLLTHATICLIASISLRFTSIEWLHEFFRIPLQFATLFATSLIAAILVVEQFRTSLSWPISCAGCCWLAALWLAVAVLEVWPALFGAFQIVLGAAWIFGAGAWLVAHGWDWREPYSLHIYALGLGALCLAWELGRVLVRTQPRAIALLSPAFISVDRFITGALIVGQYVLSLSVVSWSIGKELSFAPEHWRVFPAAWHEHAYSIGAWLLPVLLAGVLILWLREFDLTLPVLAFTLLVLTIPLLIAGAWFDEPRASASAARWGLAICYGACSLLLWQRHRLGGPRGALVPTVAMRALLIVGAVAPVLLITLNVVVPKLAGHPIPGALEGMFFAMGGPVSMLLPLALLSATLAGHGYRERRAYYLLAAGLLANASSVGAFFLGLQMKEIKLVQASIVVDALLLATGVAWLWSILWTWVASLLEPDEERPLLDSPLLTINSLLGAVFFSGALLRALQWIMFSNTESGGHWTQETGSPWSWLVYALMSLGSCFFFWKRCASLPLHLLGVLSLAVVGVIACTVERFSPDNGFLALMFLCGVYACGWAWCNHFLDPEYPPRWLTFTSGRWESSLYAVIAGGLAVFLGCATLVNAKHPVWSAESILLSGCACSLLAYQRKTEIWASFASLLVMLASTIVVMHFGQEETHLLLLTIQVNLAVLGAMALLRLGLHRVLAPGSVELSQLRHLPVQIALGTLANFVLIFIALLALVVLPDHPGAWLQQHAVWAGWLAVLTNVIALVWYVSLVRPSAVVHAVALGGLFLGVVLAGTIDSIFVNVSWIAHHVLTLSWTLLGLFLQILSWASHAQTALGPQFWQAERRTQLADFLRRCFPEATTRAWVTLCGGFVVVLALRATWVDPAAPFWSVGNTFAVSILLGALAIWSRAPAYILGSGLLFNVIGLLLFTAWSKHRLDALGPLLANDEWLSYFVLAQILSFGCAAIVWSLLERKLLSKGIDLSQGIPLPFTQAALLAGIHLLAVGVGFANGLHLVGEEVRVATALAWGALGILVIAVLLELWRPQFHRFTRFQLYTCGLLAIGLFLHGMSLSISDWYWAATLLLAGYVLLIVALLRLAHASPRLQAMLHLPAKPDSGGRWFWHVQLGGIGLVLVLSMWITLTYPTLEQCLGGAVASLLVTAAALLLVKAWPRVYPVEDETQKSFGLHHRLFPNWLVLTLGVVSALELCLGFLIPTMTAVWLQRSAAALALLTAATLFYRFVLPRGLAGSSWVEPSRSLCAILGAVSVVLLLALIGQELVLYDAAEGVKRTPLRLDLAVLAGLAFISLTAYSLYLALTKEGDSYGVEGQRRCAYVYLSELLALGLLVHVRLNLPALLPPVLGKYWYLSVMALAFSGVALSEVFAAKAMPVLATPFKHSAMMLAFVPVLFFRLVPIAGSIKPLGDHIKGLQPFLKYLDDLPNPFFWEALCWLLLGVFFGWLAHLRKSANFGIAAALAVNFGVWVLLGHQDATTFLQRPQLWLIPLGLIVLVSEYVNRDRLGFWPSLWVRYAGLLCIYLSSTFEMFKEELGSNPIFPIVLTLLAVAGMLLGILFRVRAFLLAGFMALVVVIAAQIWHAAIDRQHYWVLWAFGISLGVIILAMFALFEKHRNDVLKMLDNMKRWH